jgi:alkanesulfonate monooxygenase SsuD/methylene tetrahydromethanopterin reductase-like flavin-dependent oxidoreductase (luciferase family)
MARVQYGVNVNTRVPVLYPEHYTATDVVALAERVEALGYDGVWVGDNFFAKGRLESIATLSAIAGRTSRVTLGTSALILPLRNTVWFAVSWATLDQLSRGRTIPNVCVGGGGAKLGGPLFAAEFDVAGVPYNRRGDVMDEQILLLRHLWTRPGELYRGEFHTVRPYRSRRCRTSAPRRPSGSRTTPSWWRASIRASWTGCSVGSRGWPTAG